MDGPRSTGFDDGYKVLVLSISLVVFTRFSELCIFRCAPVVGWDYNRNNQDGQLASVNN